MNHLNILLSHNRYLTRGGEDESVDSHHRLLVEKGHNVTFYEKNNEEISEIGKIKTAKNTIWSHDSAKEVKDLINKNKIDILDSQNFFPLISPSILSAAKKKNIPVIQTLRNFRLICPNGLFFRDGGICEDCLGKRIPYPAIKNKCYKDSTAGSIVASSMVSVHNYRKTWYKDVDYFIALTNFSKEKFIESGLPAEKIIVKPNFVYPDPGSGQGTGDYLIYVGRLTVDKGVKTLIEGWKLANKRNLKLKIIGEGPLEEYVKENMRKDSSIEYLGKLPVQEVYKYMGEAKLLIFPSEWYETFGRVAVEAFAKGTPVIGTNIGAMNEIITEERTGFKYKVGNYEDLSSKISYALSNEDKLAQMRLNARFEYLNKYTADKNYERIVDIYDMAIKKR
jgi:glycosyltransferase involved in cell wall biosynthesis